MPINTSFIFCGDTFRHCWLPFHRLISEIGLSPYNGLVALKRFFACLSSKNLALRTPPPRRTFTPGRSPGRLSGSNSLLNLVDRMASEVKRAFEAVPAHGMEIGGLLLGTAFVSRPIIEIKGFEPFLSEYRTDYKFILSDSDRRQLERRLAARKAEPSDELT